MTGTITAPRHAAAMIVSVVQATIHVKPVFDLLSPQEIDEIVLCWANLIEANPETATEQIWQSISDRPGLGEAWRKSGPGGPLSRRLIFENIILEYA